jgi:ketosteroid isomerase-like protein
MLLFLVQTILLIAAGLALFRLWRLAAPSQRWLYLAVATGFLARAVFGQALFWISYLRLPIGRSLQLGNGFWVFAQDATWYFPEAARVAGDGVRAILMYDRGASSVMYEQVLSTFIYLFGTSVANGLLINLFCYLGMVAILVRWSRIQPRTATAAALAIAGLTFSPAFVLWSLQPMKDPFFQLLFVAFIAACAAWQRAWSASGRWAPRLGTAALLVVLLFALAGIRWYFAAVLIVAASLFMLMVAFQAPRRGLALASAAVVAFLLAQSLAISAAPYLPERVRAVLNPRTTFAAITGAPGALFGSVEAARAGFDHTAASTMIRTGERLRTKTAPAAAPPPPAVQVVTVVKETPKPKAAEATPPKVTPPPKPAPRPEPKVVEAPPPVKVAATATVAAPPPPPPQVIAQPIAQPETPKAVAAATPPAPKPEPKIVEAPPPPAPHAVMQAIPETPLAAADAADVRAVVEAEVTSWNRRDLAGFTSWWWTSPKFELQFGGSVVHGINKAVELLGGAYPKAHAPQAAAGDVRMTGAGGLALVRAQWTASPPDQPPFTGPLKMVLRRFPEGWKVVRLHLPKSAEAVPAAQTEMVEIEAPPSVPVAEKHVEQPVAPPIAATQPAPAPAPARGGQAPLPVPVSPPARGQARVPVLHRAHPAPPAPAPAPTPVPPPPAFTDADAAQIRAVLAAQAAAWNAKDLGRFMATYARTPEPELADGPRVVRGWQPVYNYYQQNYAVDGGGLGTLTFSSVVIVGASSGDTAAISGNCRLLGAGGEGRGGDFSMQMRRFPDGWKVARVSVPVLPTVESEAQPRVVRALAGTAALLLPRIVGEALGLVHVRGGRGMLWFAEIDTLVFDAVLLLALLALAARSAAPWRNPLTWLVLLTTVLIFGPLAYTIGNFGTLFRLREMIYVGLLLVPLAVAARGERTREQAS